MDDIDAVFQALADPSRRRLLDLLQARNGRTLVELRCGLGVSRQTSAKHLAVLAERISSRFCASAARS